LSYEVTLMLDSAFDANTVEREATKLVKKEHRVDQVSFLAEVWLLIETRRVQINPSFGYFMRAVLIYFLGR